MLRVSSILVPLNLLRVMLHFQRAKEEGMDVAIHWQDADSSSAKAEIMLCGGHAGRGHRNILEKRQKNKTYHQPIL